MANKSNIKTRKIPKSVNKDKFIGICKSCGEPVKEREEWFYHRNKLYGINYENIIFCHLSQDCIRRQIDTIVSHLNAELMAFHNYMLYFKNFKKSGVQGTKKTSRKAKKIH